MTKELREQRKKLAEDAGEFLKKAKAENREMTAEEETKFDAIHADIKKLADKIDRLEKQEEVEASLTEGQGRRTQAVQPTTETRAALATSMHQENRIIRSHEGLEGLRAWLLAGSDVERTPELREAAAKVGVNLDQKQYRLRLPANALRANTSEALKTWEERAALGVGSAGIGGNIVPDEMMRALEVALLQFGGVRQVATVMRTDGGGALPIPTVDDTSNSGVLLAENTVVAELEMTFGQLVLNAYKYSSKYILCSVELLQDSAINLAEYLGSALGTRIGRITNTHFTTGTGSAQPNGIVTASTQGKEAAGGQTTSIIYDDLIDLEHSVDPAYRVNGRWMFNDTTLKALKKLRAAQFSGDTTGLPIWLPGLAVREPDTILGYPYTINQAMASMAASAKAVLFGDLSKYIVRDVRDVTLLRLDERFADYHQVAFLAFARSDGDLLDAGTHPVKHFANPAA